MIRLRYTTPITGVTIPGTHSLQEVTPIEVEGGYEVEVDEMLAYLPLMHGSATLVDPPILRVCWNYGGGKYDQTFYAPGVTPPEPEYPEVLEPKAYPFMEQIQDDMEEAKKKRRGGRRKKEWVPLNGGEA